MLLPVLLEPELKLIVSSVSLSDILCEHLCYFLGNHRQQGGDEFVETNCLVAIFIQHCEVLLCLTQTLVFLVQFELLAFQQNLSEALNVDVASIRSVLVLAMLKEQVLNFQQILLQLSLVQFGGTLFFDLTIIDSLYS